MFLKSNLWVAFALLFSFLCASKVGIAQDVTIPGGDSTAFQAALTAAQDNGQDDTILLEPGTYKTSNSVDTFGYSSNTKENLTIQGKGPDVFLEADPAILLGTLRIIFNSGTIRLENLHFRNSSGIGGDYLFGAVFIQSQSNPTADVEVQVVDCSFENNTARAKGTFKTNGALKVTLRPSVNVIPKLLLSHNIFKDNSIEIVSDGLLTNPTTATGAGAALFCDDKDLAQDHSCSFLIENNLFLGNKVFTSLASLTNFENLGAGLFVGGAPSISTGGDKPDALLVHNTFVNNTLLDNILDSGAGFGAIGNGNFVLVNNLFYNNTKGANKEDFFVRGINANSAIQFNGSNANAYEKVAQSQIDALGDKSIVLTESPVEEADHYHLKSNSVCIDAGVTFNLSANQTLPFDIDGDARPFGTTAPDIGADESDYTAGSGGQAGNGGGGNGGNNNNSGAGDGGGCSFSAAAQPPVGYFAFVSALGLLFVFRRLSR